MPDKNPTAALEQIAKGGQVLAALSRGRLSEAMDAIAEGDFGLAYERCQEALAKLGPLANAQAHVGRFDGNLVVRARDVSVGAVLQGLGKVVDKDVQKHECVGNDHEHDFITLTFEGDVTQHYDGDQELVLATRLGQERPS